MTDFKAEDNTGTVPVQDRHQVDLEALTAFMVTSVAGFQGPMQIEEFAGGQSNPTYLLTTPDRRYVLRRKPPGELLKSAHAVDREYKVLTGLADADVPTARTYALCTDDSVIGTWFYVMEYLDGRVIWDATHGPYTPQERFEIWDAANLAVAKLHRVDYKQVGLSDFGKESDYIARQLSRWGGQYEYTKTVDNPYMDNLLAYLPANIPSSDDCTIVHGDLQIANMMMHKDRNEVIGILDWELSTLGCPIADFAYLCRPYRDAFAASMSRPWGSRPRRPSLRLIVNGPGVLGLPSGIITLPLTCSKWRQYCKVSPNECSTAQRPVSRLKLPALGLLIWRNWLGRKSILQ